MDHVVSKPAPEMQEAAVAITLSTELGQHRSLTFQTAIARDDALKGYDAILDKLLSAADRQAARANVERYRAELAQEELIIKQNLDDLQKLRAGMETEWKRQNKQGPMKANDTQKARESQIEINVKNHQLRATTLKAEIENCEKAINRT